jgi:hypothetical protein
VQELARLHGECENLLLQIGGLEERLGGVLSPPGPVSAEPLLEGKAPSAPPSPITLGIAEAAGKVARGTELIQGLLRRYEF